jgi:hypothetical protein
MELSKDVSDTESQVVLQTMLNWNIPAAALPFNNNNNAGESPFTGKIVLVLIFSFGEASSSSSSSLDPCWNSRRHKNMAMNITCFGTVGPTNELLAATAAQSWNTHKHTTTKMTILAQWEVATALQHKYGIPAISIGTPGVYSNTAEILHQMQTHLLSFPPSSMNRSDNLQASSSSSSSSAQSPMVLVLLAHPDHLRRVLWTAQTILSSQTAPNMQQSGEMQSYYLRNKSTNQQQQSSSSSAVTAFSSSAPLMYTAMQPYHWSWPRRDVQRFDTDETSATTKQRFIINLYNQVQATVMTNDGQRIQTSWYNDDDDDDDNDARLGYFATNDDDRDTQPWTRNRDVWKLYDHWAILKGIVTGSIDISKISSQS